MTNVFNSIRHLTLHMAFIDTDVQRSHHADLARIVDAAPNLHTLDVRLWNTSLDPVIDTGFVPECCRFWPALHTLKISNFYTPESALRKFLNSHADFIRSLELRSTHITRSEDQKNPTSWISIIQFLQSSLTLDHVRLERALRSAWGEEWYSLSKMNNALGIRLKEPKPFGPNCLRCRVEQYVIGGGPCPLSDSNKTSPRTPRDQPFYSTDPRIIYY